MRILSGHLTPLDRQTTESVNILEAEKVPGRSLNLKTEWGGSKIPSILVHSPRGLLKSGSSLGEGDHREEDQEDIEAEQRLHEALRRGQKYL